MRTEKRLLEIDELMVHLPNLPGSEHEVVPLPHVNLPVVLGRETSVTEGARKSAVVQVTRQDVTEDFRSMHLYVVALPTNPPLLVWQSHEIVLGV